MTTTEERLRETMRAHDHVAPHALHWAPRPAPEPQLRRRWIAAGVVVVLAAAAIAVAVWWPTADRTTPVVTSGPLTCPRASAGSALATPTAPAGVDTAGHLVPAATPTAAVVCAYATVAEARGPGLLLTDPISTSLQGDLDGIPAQWRDLPTAAAVQQACSAQVLPPVYRLVGLDYPGGGRVWISASTLSSCGGSSNGVFSSRATLTQTVDTWAAAGRVTPPTPLADCAATGRLGDEQAMVPGTPERVVVCATSELTRATTTTTFGTETATGLAAAANAVPAAVSATPPCEPDAGPPRTDYALRFEYPTGPAVQVRLPAHCGTITNSVRVTDGVGDLGTVLARVLAGG